MKILKQDYRKLRNAIHSTLLALDIAQENQVDYQNAGWTPKRFRWAVVSKLKIKIFGDGVGMVNDESIGDLNLYSYLNDSHIDTAIRVVMKELGYSWASETGK